MYYGHFFKVEVLNDELGKKNGGTQHHQQQPAPNRRAEQPLSTRWLLTNFYLICTSWKLLFLERCLI